MARDCFRSIAKDIGFIKKRAPRRRNRILEYQLYIRNRIPNLDGLPDPRLFAAHAPLVSLPRSVMRMGCKIVYVCRDPKDVLISHWNFVNKFRARDGLEALSVETAADFFCDGVTLSGPYWDHVLGYWRAQDAPPQKFSSSGGRNAAANPVAGY
ncbi:Sulfotransferase 17 [Triticum urartu]|uniref:Sulfotransferase n=1 Tax=Triticum urartu TaxID=4572 RepID=M7ZHA8_TRIUA|nr:Sulfotransferase 17 [Triticum urartu]